MEMGKAATHSPHPHYSRRWDYISPEDPFYSTESWKDQNFSAPVAGDRHSWREFSAATASLLSPSPSQDLPPESSVDKVLLHNLVEMIPLVETFMEQKQNKRSFRRRASLIFTSNPRDAANASEPRSRSRKVNGQLFRDDQVEQNKLIAHLQDQMEQLELKLLEKDSQVQAVENSMRQADLMHMQASVEELQEQLMSKETEMEKTINQLLNMQLEVGGLQYLVERAESDAKASNLNASKVHEESQRLQCQVAAVLLWMESISSRVGRESADEELDNLSVNRVYGQEGGTSQAEVLDADAVSVELIIRNYSAAIIAARHNPTDELLVLVAELRGQLQASLLILDNGVGV